MVRMLLRILVVAALISLQIFTLYAVLHPRVSADYRAYYIDHTSVDWKPPHYAATPESGIDFTRPGWPDFVSQAYGFSFHDDWGRWTDAVLQASPTIVMNHYFSGPTCIEIVARPSVAETGRRVEVAFGQSSGAITLSNPDFARYDINLDNVQPTGTLQFRFFGRVPRAADVSPGSTDERRLGIAISSIRILPSHCQSLADNR